MSSISLLLELADSDFIQILLNPPSGPTALDMFVKYVCKSQK